MPHPKPVEMGSGLDFCVYYARQTREIYQVLLYSVDLKAPGEPWNPLICQCSSIWNKDLQTSQMTVKLKINLYVGPVRGQGPISVRNDP